MGIKFHCMICHQAFDFDNVFDIDFLWNDDLSQGQSVCKGCAVLFIGNLHLNYEVIDINEIIETGIDKWL